MLFSPQLKTSNTSSRAIVIAGVVVILLGSIRADAATVGWDGGTTGGGTGWLIAANWVGDTIPSNTDIAQFASLGTATTIGIDFSGATNNGTANQAVGAIELLSTRARTINNSSSTAGTLTLNGATVNSVSNVILRNASTFLLTLADGSGSNKAMDVALGNATNNVVMIDGSGGITISSKITGSGKNLTLGGSGSGILTFTGAVANTYSGTTTINSGELDLDKSGNKDAIAGNLTIGDGTGTDTVKLLRSNNIADTSDVTINSSGVLNLNGKLETIDALISSSSTASVTLGIGTLTVGADNQPTASFAGVISGVGGNLAKSGSGTQTLTGNNIYTGTTTINASGGTLEIANSGSTSSGRISGTSNVTVNSGGTLLLSGSSGFTDRINNSATITMAGGTFRLSGVSEGIRAAQGVGALTLSSSSIIDLSSTSLLHFAASNTQTWTGTLSIYNWSGTPVTGGGAEALLFGTNTSSLTAAQLSQISFYSDGGTTFLGTGIFATIGDGEVVPVPESSTWICGALALAAVSFTQLRKRSRAGGRAVHATR